MAKETPTTPKSNTNKKPRKSKGTTGLWSIKGIDNETRTKTTRAAKKRKETIGSYVNRVLLEASNNDLSSKSNGTEVAVNTDEMIVKMFQQQEAMVASQSALASKVEELVAEKDKPLLKRVFG